MKNAADTLAAQQQALAALLLAETPPVGPAWLRAVNGRPARLDVYHHAYRARLTEALRSNYPVLHRVLGDEAFGDIARRYLAERPSRRPSIRWFGEALPQWLAARADTLPHPSLVDLARMEWALGLSFDAADMPPLDVATLAARPAGDWPGFRFAAHPSVSLLVLDWAVEPLWRRLTDDDQAACDPPAPHPHHWLTWRHGLESRWRSVEADEAIVLSACLAGEPFASVCALAVATHGDAAAAWVAGALRRWVADGLLLAA
jgi:hypothetical protein